MKQMYETLEPPTVWLGGMLGLLLLLEADPLPQKKVYSREYL